MRFLVVGAGSWGTAFARVLLDRSHDVVLACHSSEQAAAIEAINTFFAGLADLPAWLPAGSIVEAEMAFPIERLQVVGRRPSRDRVFEHGAAHCAHGRRRDLPARVADDLLDEKVQFADLPGSSRRWHELPKALAPLGKSR